MANTAFSGARATLKIEGTIIGWCTGVRGNENIALQRIDVLGNIDSESIEPIGRTVTMSADFVRILKSSLETLDIWPSGGTADVLNFEDMTAEIFDEVGDSAGVSAGYLYKVEGLKCESRNFQVDRQGLMTVNASFQGLRLYTDNGV